MKTTTTSSNNSELPWRFPFYDILVTTGKTVQIKPARAQSETEAIMKDDIIINNNIIIIITGNREQPP